MLLALSAYLTLNAYNYSSERIAFNIMDMPVICKTHISVLPYGQNLALRFLQNTPLK